MLKLIQSTIKISNAISPKLSAEIALTLCARPYNVPRPKREQQQIDQAIQSSYYGALGNQNPYWSWGQGPVVVLCHGWSCRGSQMATMAMSIAKAGFKAVVFDCSAHGEAKGKSSGFDVMAKDIYRLFQEFEDVHAFVSHSMGGMMTMKARDLGLKANRYVVIGSPAAPLPIVEKMKNVLKVPNKSLNICKQKIALQFDTTWSTLVTGEVYRDCYEPLLMIYDIDDNEFENPLQHAQTIKERCPSAEIITTKGLGHHKLVWDREIINSVVNFLNR